MIAQAQIVEWFHIRELKDEQQVANREVMTAARIFAETVNKHVPDSEEKVQALQQLRGVVLTCELAVRNQWPKSAIELVQ